MWRLRKNRYPAAHQRWRTPRRYRREHLPSRRQSDGQRFGVRPPHPRKSRLPRRSAPLPPIAASTIHRNTQTRSKRRHHPRTSQYLRRPRRIADRATWRRHRIRRSTQTHGILRRRCQNRSPATRSALHLRRRIRTIPRRSPPPSQTTRYFDLFRPSLPGYRCRFDDDESRPHVARPRNIARLLRI